MTSEIFRRQEHKYLITQEQYKAFTERLSRFMQPDPHGLNGKYTVTTLYFDSMDYQIYLETKNKLPFRQKLRLRIYDESTLADNAFFEIKQKRRNFVHKKRTILPLEKAYHSLANSPSLKAYQSSNSAVFDHIHLLRKWYALNPKMIVSYDRHAFHQSKNTDLRVTFDLNLRCRNDNLAIEKGPHGDYFIDPQLIILEVKTSEAIPSWLMQILEELNCTKRSISKFCASLEKLNPAHLPTGFKKERTTLTSAF